ncbi:hypothetical protein BT69DRAFT_1287587 [Atractiella rhizophila]|nr:hypothetical protein BT69DRAFT_1287587 [Atractiella rhizophila]
MAVSIPFCIYGNHPRLSSMTAIGPGAGLLAEYEDICPVLKRLWEWRPVRDQHGQLVLPPMDQALPAWNCDQEPERPFNDEDTALPKYRAKRDGLGFSEALRELQSVSVLAGDEGKESKEGFWNSQSVGAWRDLADREAEVDPHL